MAKAKAESHCPNCGYCPHCGRSNQPYRMVPTWWPPPYWVNPYQPYWINAPTITYGTSAGSGNWSYTTITNTLE